MMSTTKLVAQTASISTSLIAAGGIATLSIFDIPELQSQPASRSLPMTRWLFSRGSHIFPTAAAISALGFLYVAYASLPLQLQTLSQLVKFGSNGTTINCYLAAAALALSIAPWTSLMMIPTNFRLIQLNEEKGGARSARTAQERSNDQKPVSAEESVKSKGAASQVSDLSGPQPRTESETTQGEDQEVKDLFGSFGRLNAVRAVLIGAGGIVGLLAALTA